jgi:hypothetical protein
LLTNEHIAFVDPSDLTTQQAIDLNDLNAATMAFWSVMDDGKHWNLPTAPINCCILVALAVQDILHATGRPDASVLRSGLDVRSLSCSPRILTIGTPSAPRLRYCWNAHATVRLGDMVGDPSHGQTKRPWNRSPRSAVFRFAAPDGHEIDVEPGCHARSIALHRYWRDFHHYQVTYFKLPRASDLATRNWRSAPDACPSRREAIVEAAVGKLLRRDVEQTPLLRDSGGTRRPMRRGMQLPAPSGAMRTQC